MHVCVIELSVKLLQRVSKVQVDLFLWWPISSQWEVGQEFEWQ